MHEAAAEYKPQRMRTDAVSQLDSAGRFPRSLSLSLVFNIKHTALQRAAIFCGGKIIQV